MSAVTVMNCPACEGEGVAGGVECVPCNGTGEVESSADALPTVQEAPWDGQERRAVAAPTDPVTSALIEVTKTNTTISEHLGRARELHERYKDVAFDVRTTKGMEAAKNARLFLRQERYPIQSLQKAGSKLLGSMQRQFNARCEEITSEIIEFERPIDEQITAEEARKENERKEREAAEQRRRQGHIDAIAAMHLMVTEASGMGSADLKAVIDGAQLIVVDEGYEEFQGQAQQAKDEALRQLNGMLVAARAEEAELEETRRAQAALKEAQAKLAEQKRLQDEQAAAMAAERAAFEREKAELAEQREQQARAVAERKEAVQRRIDFFAMYAAPYSSGAASLSLRSAIATIHDNLITTAMFDDRTQEAEAAKASAIADLTAKYDAAVEREAEEARLQRAANIQELIEGIRNMGEKAALAVEDGSANVEELRAGLEELLTTDCVTAFFDGRVIEALQVRDAAIASTKQAILETLQRDILRAEEAAREREQQAEQEREHKRLRRIQDEAYVMFLLLGDIRDHVSFDQLHPALQERITKITAEIEGEQHA